MSIWDELRFVNLASNASFHRGLEYHLANRVIHSEETDRDCFQGKVNGSGQNVYEVMIDLAHPRKSTCTCPFAEGRRVICKHKVALYFYHFPEIAEAVLAEWEEEVEERDRRYRQWEKERAIYLETVTEEVTAYVNQMSNEEVRAQLINQMIRRQMVSFPDFEEEDYDHGKDYFGDQAYYDEDYDDDDDDDFDDDGPFFINYI